jgi:hypothetical protein
MTERLQHRGLSAILSADWGKQAGKRAVFVADIPDRIVRRISRRDWSVDTVLAEAGRWTSRGTVLVTFDAPLGVPESYLAAAGHSPLWPAPATFLELLEYARSTSEFFEGTSIRG